MLKPFSDVSVVDVELLVAEVRQLLQNAQYADGTAMVLTQDCEALETALERLEEPQ